MKPMGPNFISINAVDPNPDPMGPKLRPYSIFKTLVPSDSGDRKKIRRKKNLTHFSLDTFGKLKD